MKKLFVIAATCLLTLNVFARNSEVKNSGMLKAEQLRFILAPYEGAGMTRCHHTATESPYDFNVVCGTETFTAHLALTAYVLEQGGMLLETLFYVQEEGKSNAASSRQSFRSNTPPSESNLSLAIRNDTAYLNVEIKGIGN